MTSTEKQASDNRVWVDALTPVESMKTLVYSPDVRVLIGHGNKTIDVTNDIVRVTLVRKENSVSTAFIVLANKGGRYKGGVIDPMDRITIHMKRISWVQVFSGYLDSVPFKQLYQGVITIKASCTLKRLLHTWWNPGLPASSTLFNQLGGATLVAGDGQTARDSGLGSILRQLLIQVGNWDASKIHISNFPTRFYNELTRQANNNQASNTAAVNKFRHLLLGDDISGGRGQYASSNPSAGAPGPLGAGQAFYIQQIIAACDDVGLGPETRDLQVAQGLQTAMAEGQAGLVSGIDSGQNKAWLTTGQTGAALRASAMSSDGAILGVACAMGESGLRNLSNPNYAESMSILPNDGPGFDHDSVGLFQQRNFAEWGTLSERMNPRQSARMFFQHLANVSGWRNMDPGQAIYAVQRGGSPAYYSGFIAEAAKLVQGQREAQQGAIAAITNNPLTGAISGLAGAAGVDVASTINSVATSAASVASGTYADARTKIGKPNPDTEGAVQEARAQIGKPYSWGAKGPMAFDCSGLFNWAFRSIGINIGANTYEQLAKGTPVQGLPQRGDLIFPEVGHVVMYLGNGMVLHAPQTGDVVKEVPMWFKLNSVAGIRRYGDNGGEDFTAPRTSPLASGPGISPGTGTSTSGSGTGGSSSEGIARNLFSYMFDPGTFLNDTAMMWGGITGHKDFIDAQPLMQMAQAVCRASLRNFQSAPNGDFVAYYPDYFGIDGKPAAMRLEDIELKDLHINRSDDQLTTHVYVAGSGQFVGQLDQTMAWLDTAGTATVEDEWLFSKLRHVGLGDYDTLTGKDMMRKFGVRPYQFSASLAGTHELEFLLACQIFMEKWAAQYETQASFTFMPELFPGMRVVVGDHKLQVYVSEVTHTCLRGSERLLTKEGTKTLRECAGTTQEVMGFRGTWTPAEIRSFGNQKLYRVVLSRYGREKEVFATAEHRWFVTKKPTRKDSTTSREVVTAELRPGDHLKSVFPFNNHLRRTESRWGKVGRRPFRDWQIASVEETEIVEEVFCAVVPDGRAFVLEDNILTGNCDFQNGFTTSAVICAPTTTSVDSDMANATSLAEPGAKQFLANSNGQPLLTEYMP